MFRRDVHSQPMPDVACGQTVLAGRLVVADGYGHAVAQPSNV